MTFLVTTRFLDARLTIDAPAMCIVLALVALCLFLFEMKVPSHGAFAAGGIVLVVLAAAILHSTLQGRRPAIEPWVIVATAAPVAALFTLIVRAALQHRRLPVVVGPESLTDQIGVAESDLGPSGVVRVASEQWTATSAAGPIAKGRPVRVRRVESIRLIVEPIPDASERGVP